MAGIRLDTFIVWDVLVPVTTGVKQLDTPGQGPDGNSTWLSAGSLVFQLIVAAN